MEALAPWGHFISHLPSCHGINRDDIWHEIQLLCLLNLEISKIVVYQRGQR